ncbi:single-strand DNA endonuclease ASTE1-like [Ptychodera flava]|uniref:single-strand DNA endonuclease ASTE1-like n=1 Tax=Ptychodera flava TaxID=63121 RepID=UPI00396A36B0
MGVRGLTTFVKNPSYTHDGSTTLLRPHQLSNTPVVIDGKGLLQWLYFENDVDCKHGGDYREYETICTEFIEALHQRGVKPFILFDGASNPDDSKVDTLLGRCRERIQDSAKIIDGDPESPKLRPPFTTAVFLKVLESKEVGYVFCDFEADSEIVALANIMGCPVIGNDSDFFVFDLTGGYIPLSSLRWKEARQLSIPCEKYSLDHFCQAYSMRREMVPLLAILLGNDYVSRETFDDLYHRVIKRSGNIPNGPNVRIPRTIRFLQSRQNFADGAKRLLKDEARRQGKEECIEKSLQAYHIAPESRYQAYLQQDPSMVDIPDCPLPAAYVDLYRRGAFPADYINLKFRNNRKKLLPNLVEDYIRPSCHLISQRIREAIYGILLHGLHDRAVQETGREGQDIKVFIVTGMPSLPEFGSLPNLERMIDLEEERRKVLVMEVLEVDHGRVQAIRDDLKLPVATTIYWRSKLDLPVTESGHHLMRVILLGIAICYSREDLNMDDVKGNLKEAPRVMNRTAVQAFAEWQSCMYYTMHLNTLVNRPYPTPDATKLYHGTLLHRIYATTRLQRDVNPDWVETDVLRGSPAALALFRHLDGVAQNQ